MFTVSICIECLHRNLEMSKKKIKWLGTKRSFSVRGTKCQKINSVKNKKLQMFSNDGRFFFYTVIRNKWCKCIILRLQCCRFLFLC